MFLPHFRAGTSLTVPVIITKGQPPIMYNPSGTVLLFIEDPDGTLQVNGQTMTLNTTGRYSYIYSTPLDGVTGNWIGWINAIDGGVVSGTVKIPLFTLTCPAP